jgi:hypothetical protein
LGWFYVIQITYTVRKSILTVTAKFSYHAAYVIQPTG